MPKETERNSQVNNSHYITIKLDDYIDDSDIHVELSKADKEEKQNQNSSTNIQQGGDLTTDSSDDMADDSIIFNEDILLDSGDAAIHDDIIDILINKSASEKAVTSDEQTFNDLLTNFRRDPSLVSKKIRLQTQQELVVSPDDIKRLIKQVRRIMQAKNEYSVDEITERPVLDEIMSIEHCNFPLKWLKPIIYDQKTIFVRSASSELLSNQQTIRVSDHSASVMMESSSFGYPGSARMRKQPYPTALLHEIARKSHTSRNTDAASALSKINNRLVLRTPVNHWIWTIPGKGDRRQPGFYQQIASQYDSSCINTIGPPAEFSYQSGTEVFRIGSNVAMMEVMTKHDLTFEKRVASLPVIEFNQDEESRRDFAIRQVYNGEEIRVIGFAICENYGKGFPDEAKDIIDKVDVISSKNQLLITKVIKPDKPKSIDVQQRKWHAYLYNEKRDSEDEMISLLKRIIPSQEDILSLLNKELENCYNLFHTDELLSEYGLTQDCLTRLSITKLRKKITQNIIRYVDFTEAISNNNLIEKNHLVRNTQKDDDKLFFYNEHIKSLNRYYQVEDFNRTSDTLFCSELSSTDDHGDVYYALRGTQWLRKENLIEVQKCLAQQKNVMMKIGIKPDAVSLHDELVLNDKGIYNSIDINNIEKLVAKDENNIRQSKMYTINLGWLTFLQKNLSEIQNVLQESTVELTKSRYQFKKRQRLKSSTASRQQLDKPIRMKDFDLMPFETGQYDNSMTGLVIEDSAVFDASSWDASFNEQETFDNTSAEYRQTQNPNLSSNVFPSGVLVNIGDQLLKMRSPEKLDFQISAADFRACVYDISEMFDELDDQRTYITKYMKARSDPNASHDEKMVLYKEAKDSFYRDIGNDTKINTNYKVGIIIARILIDLETHRPKYAFKKIFALSGRKTIGRKEDIKDEIYNENNKFNYLVTVASRGSGLGARGVLMENSQADNLKNIVSYATVIYDKYLARSHIQKLYSRSQDFDNQLLTISKELNRQDDKSGFNLILCSETTINNNKTKFLINAHYEYNYSLEELNTAFSKLYSNYNELIDLRHILRKKAKYLTFKRLQMLQQYVEDAHVTDFPAGSYNPDQYGDEAGDAGCRPGFICIYHVDSTRFLSQEDHKTDESQQVIQLMNFTRIERSLMSLPKKTLQLTYDKAEINRSNIRPEDMQVYISQTAIADLIKDCLATTISETYLNFLIKHKTSYIHKYDITKSAFVTPSKLDLLHQINTLTDQIALRVDKNNARQFSDLLLSGLGRWVHSYTYARLQIAEHPEWIRNYQWNWLIPVYQANSQFLRNCNRYFRKHISLLKHGLSVISNEYLLKSDIKSGIAKTIDEEAYSGTVKRKVVIGNHAVAQNEIFWLRQSQEMYLLKFAALEIGVRHYKFINSLADIEKPKKSTSNTDAEITEVLLNKLVSEMISLMSHFQREHSGLLDILSEFYASFVNWCGTQQAMIDTTITDTNLDLQRRQEQETRRIDNLSKSEKNDIFNLRSVGLWRGYNDPSLDEENTEFDPAINHQKGSNKSDFDLLESETSMNIFEGETDE